MQSSLRSKVKLAAIAIGLTGFVVCDMNEIGFYTSNIWYGNVKYSKKGFWDEEYKDNTSVYDWYVRYGDIESKIKQNIDEKDEILHIGAGNSCVAEELYESGYKNITNIDIAEEVINAMIKRYDEKGYKMKYLKMDMLDLQFPTDSFDVVLDKAGSDILLVGWRPFKKYRLFLDQLDKVLKKNGKFIYFTLFPNFPIRKVVDMNKWSVKEYSVGNKFSVLILMKL